MSRPPERAPRPRLLAACTVLAAMLVAASAIATDRFPGIGRPATEREIAAWDIDVRPDFLGLPKGSGTVEQGMEVWEAKCASCHGTFGESNQVFTPLVGGTTAADITSGNVANLRRVDYPQRTTMMKAPYVATLFDYIRRAMPWNEPKSLSDDEVYAVLAYMLNLAEVVPDDFRLGDASMAEVQARMPNRNGMTTAHAMWPGRGFPSAAARPDTANAPCMSDCAATVEVASALPDYARPAHGNLASQHRRIGPVRGIVTGDDDPDATDDPSPPAMKRAKDAGCMACHGIANKVVGPSYADVARRYRGVADALDLLAGRVRNGAEGVWGALAMPAQEDVSDADARLIVEWILAGAPER
ncbi:MAG: c-type cytochrome [Alphaproteobacteria bacterium]